MVEYVCIRVGQAKFSEMEYNFFVIGIISPWKTMRNPGKNTNPMSMLVLKKSSDIV